MSESKPTFSKEVLEEIELLEKNYVLAGKKISECMAAQEQTVTYLIYLCHRVRVGDVVRWKGKEYKIQRFDTHTWNDWSRRSRPWVYGYPKKKDGEWGSNPRCLYAEWERLDEPEAVVSGC